MAYLITKSFTFAAAHRLHTLPDTHKCARLHGHNYTVTVALQGSTLDKYGFVEDYGRLADVKEYLDNVLDHRNLSDLFEWMVTAENLAAHIYHRVKPDHPRLVAVTVNETPNTTATYRQDEDQEAS